MQKKFNLVICIMLMISISFMYSKPVHAEEKVFVAGNEQSFFEILSYQATVHNEKIVINYYGDIEELFDYETDSKKIMDIIIKKIFNTNNPYIINDFDYLYNNYKNCKMSYATNGKSTTFTLQMAYNTTTKQENNIKTQVHAYLKDKKIHKLSDYQKIKATHDFVIKNTSYDQTYSKYTAYNALVQKSAVCQGYTLLMYYMLDELNVPARIITGTANEGAHSWLIVKLNNYWYNVDPTWDDPILSKEDKNYVSYAYFLKTNVEMTSHIRNEEYNTKEFNKSYPMAKTSYKESMDKGYKSADTLLYYKPVTSLTASTNTLNLEKGQSESLGIKRVPSDSTDNRIYYLSSDTSVAVVNNKGVVVGKKSGNTVVYAYTPTGITKAISIKVK